MTLHPQVKDKLDQIERIVIETQEPGVRIIDKTGPLRESGRSRSLHPVHGRDPADLRPADGRRLRRRRRQRSARRPAAQQDDRCARTRRSPQEYYAADKRYIGNAVQVFFKDGVIDRARGGGLSDRPSQAPRGGHAGAGEEVRSVDRGALLGEADRGHQGAVCRSGEARADAGAASSLPAWSRTDAGEQRGPTKRTRQQPRCTMSANFRTLLITRSDTSRALLARLLDGSDIVIDDVVPHDQVIASVARRAPDLIVIDAEGDAQALTQRLPHPQGEPGHAAAAGAGAGEVGQAAPRGIRCGSRRLSDAPGAARGIPGSRARALLRSAPRGANWLPSSSRRRCVAAKLIRAAFRRYISPKLADRILENPELRDSMFSGTQRARHAAVMFADMRGFTGISERLSPPRSSSC